MPVTNTPLRYPGGKTALTGFVQKVLEENDLAGGVYAEPFAGGAGIAVNLLMSGHARKIVINDLDEAVYNFWLSLLRHPQEMIRLVRETALNVSEWQRQKEYYRNPNASLLEKGFATLYLNRCNRSGILTANPIGGLEQTGPYPIDARFNRNMIAGKIEIIAAMADQIEVRNEDARTLLKRLRYRKDAMKTFVFLDPPYYVKGSDLYFNHLQPQDHRSLAKAIHRSRLAWMVTYDDVPETRAFYGQHQLVPFDLNYSAFKSRYGKEILVLKEGLKMPPAAISANFSKALGFRPTVLAAV